MNDGIEHAVKLHSEGNHDEALSLYIKNLKSEHPDLRAFVNTPVLLRAKGELAQAIKILKAGIKIHPKEPGLHNNLGNVQSDLLKHNEAIYSYRTCLNLDPRYFDAKHSLIRCLFELGHKHMAYGLACSAYNNLKEESEKDSLLILMIEIILSTDDSGENLTNQENSEDLISFLESKLYSKAGEDKPGKAQMILANLWIQMTNVDKAIECNSKIMSEVSEYLEVNKNDLNTTNTEISIKPSFRHQINSLNWAISILLLKKGRLKEGWKLFDHGLRVKASGPQRWQRALYKPFSTEEIKLWKGENLSGKNILLLAEQGIGDTMMFATLIPTLVEEGAKVSLYTGPRLDSIYKRSFDNVKIIDRDRKPNADEFDFQSPLGSLPQYRFNDVKDYARHTPILKSDRERTELLRAKYYEGKPLVGISWKGGGKSSRIPLKSVELNQLLKILKRQDVTFVSLQYGNMEKEIKDYCDKYNIKILNDDSVNPLKDMDTWVSQVDAMDYVISVANTTIHGAGGLGKPTFCLVSNRSDWRWIDSDIHNDCYWYKSVSAGFQAKKASWDHTVDKADKWLTNMLKSNS